MDFNFMWAAPSGGAPIVTIASYGITFNSVIIEQMHRPKRIMIGYDDKEKLIGIKPIYENSNHDSRSFPFIERERNGYIRVSNKDFIKYVAEKANLDVNNAIRFIADWKEDKKLALIDLKKPMDSDTKSSD